MTGAIKLRLAGFIFAIVIMVGLISWTAHSSWRRTGELREKLSSVQVKSFQIADHIQQTLLELNNAVLRFGATHDTNEWARFGTASTNLDQWIDIQRPILTTEKEKLILDLINTNYDYYMAAVRQLDLQARTNASSSLDLTGFAEFEKQSQRILSLGLQLADAHRESLDSFLASSKR